MPANLKRGRSRLGTKKPMHAPNPFQSHAMLIIIYNVIIIIIIIMHFDCKSIFMLLN